MFEFTPEEKAAAIGETPFGYAGILARARNLERGDVWQALRDLVRDGEIIIEDALILEWRGEEARLSKVDGITLVPLGVWNDVGKQVLQAWFAENDEPLERFDLVSRMHAELQKDYPAGWSLVGNIEQGDTLKALLDGGAELDEAGDNFVSAPA